MKILNLLVADLFKCCNSYWLSRKDYGNRFTDYAVE
jgi:hypothetical protein